MGVPCRRFDVVYHEGTAVGYKWIDLRGLTPLFSLGHGMSPRTGD
jgi:beta-glucosidase